MSENKMEFSETYMISPPTIRELALEIRKLVDAYWARQIDIEDVYIIASHWAEFEKEKLYSQKNPEHFNSSILSIIGQKRSSFLAKILHNDVFAKNLFKINTKYKNFREGVVREAN